MKLVLTTIAIASTLTLVGCNKTKKVTAAHISPPISDVDVEVDDNQIVIMVAGEERVIDLSGILGGIDLDDIGGEMKIEVMVSSDESDSDGQWHVNPEDMEGKHEIHMIVNGEEVEGLPDEIMEHVMEMVRRGFHMPEGTNPRDAHRRNDGHGEGHGDMPGDHDMDPEIREHVMEMLRQGFHMPEGMNPRDAHRRNDGHGEGHGDMPGDHDIPEEHQFMEELRMFNAVAEHLAENEAVAIMGIHMIRNQLEGELRLESLEAIIDGAEEGSPARNAALIVAIETLREGGDSDRAADLMVELVLSN